MMADGRDPYRRAEDIGSDSPASEEAKEQGASGDRGGPRQARERGTPKQPAQTSGRRSAAHEQEPEVRKRFDPDERPSRQGEGEPGPDRLKRRSSEQGIEPRSGSHSAHGERTEEIAQEGPPADEPARHGRQHLPGR